MTKRMGINIFSDQPQKIKVETGEEDFMRRTYMIRKKYIGLIDRQAYWERREKQQVLDEALEAYFKDKNIKPIPSLK
jgi:hypothetical protein